MLPAWSSRFTDYPPPLLPLLALICLLLPNRSLQMMFLASMPSDLTAFLELVQFNDQRFSQPSF
jgi:hypothetical protein